MIKSLEKFIGGVLVALVLIVATSGLQAFADTYPDPEREGVGTPAAPEQAVITKHLEMPIGTTPPNATFTFEFTPLGTAANPLPPNSQEDIGLSTQTAPAINSIDATVTTTTTTVAQPAPRADVVRATINTADALSRPAPNNITWPGPGVFVYRVREAGTFTNTAREHMYFDPVEYNLYITIGEAVNGDLYVRGTHAWARNPETGANEGPKLNPNPWRPENGGSDLIFINRFIRRTDDITTTVPRPPIDGPGTPVPGPGGTPNPGVPGGLESALIISKRVTGSTSSVNSTFTFSGALTHTTLVNEIVADPEISNSGETYGLVRAWVYYNNGDDFVRGRRAPAGTLPTFYDFTPGTTPGETGPLTTFELRHGEVLIFERIPVGNIFVTTETNSLTYHPSIDLMVNGQAIVPRAALTAPGTIGTANVGTPPHRIGEASNIAAFTNTNDPVPITGLIMNNLPIILVAAGVIGLVTVVVVNKKHRSFAYNLD